MHAFAQAPPAPLSSKIEEQAKSQMEAAKKLKDAGTLEPAVEALQQLIADAPQSAQVPEAYWLLGQIHTELKKPDEAGPYFRRLLEEYPESEHVPEARLALASVLLETGQPDAALPLLLEAKVQTTDRALLLTIHRHLEEAYLAKQDHVRAIESAVEVAKLSSEEERKKIEDRVRDLLKSTILEKDLRRIADKHAKSFPADAALLRLMELYEASGEDHKVSRVAREFLGQFPQHEKAGAATAAIIAQRKKPLSKTYRIGALLPLSGQLSPYGTDVLNGVRIALEVVAEASPSLSVGLVTKDTEGDAKHLARELEDLLKEYQPIAVIGPLLSREVKAVGQAAEMNEVVFVTPTATVQDVQKFGRYLFNTAVNNRALVRDLAAYATGPMGWKRFCILASRDAYGTEMAQAFTEEIRRLGGEIIASEAYAPEDTDFGPPIKRIKDLDLKKYGTLEKIESAKKGKSDKIYHPGFDAIFLPGDAEKVGLIAGQFRFYAASVGMLGTNGMNSPELIRLDPRGVEGAVFADSFSMDSPDPAVQNFVERYVKRFQQPPTSFGAQAFEATKLALDAILKGATTGRALRESLKNAKNVPGLVGPLTMTPAGSLERRYAIIQVKNGKFVSVTDAR
jgi:ABC-type branched-subunit amino acid transport system substrate-binding protein/predicted negative regulator of RcsB-dependent stress response